LVVFTPRSWKNYEGSSRCGHGFCAGACRVQADTGRSRARLCGLQACQQRQVIGNYRRPDVSLEVLEAAPGGTSQAVGALETRDAGLDQLTDLQRDSRSPAAPSGFPAPEQSKSSTVPANHGLGPDDGQRIYNARNQAIQANDDQSVESAEHKSLPGSWPQHIDLLPENQDFRLKPSS